MKYRLAIDTSTKPIGVVLGNDDIIAFNYREANKPNNIIDLSGILEAGLKEINHTIDCIECIGINIGPGPLASIRTGVAFTNSLAYSLKIPIFTCNTFELINKGIIHDNDFPILYSIRSTTGMAYACIMKKNHIVAYRYGLQTEIFVNMAKKYEKINLAGSHIAVGKSIIPNIENIVESTNCGNVLNFFKFSAEEWKKAQYFPFIAIPLTEQSEVFNE